MTAIETLGSLIESSDEEIEETSGPGQTTVRAKNVAPLTRMQVPYKITFQRLKYISFYFS